MNSIRVLIVDDEPLARRGIRRLLAGEPDFVVAGEANNGRAAASAIQKLLPDVVFLDIQMPLVDGFSLVETLHAAKTPEIVFVTAYDEHAVRAFEAGAMDYVLKPIDPGRFEKTLERIRRRASLGERSDLGDKVRELLNNLPPKSEGRPARLAVKQGERIRFLNTDQIDWISSSGNYVEIHAAGEKFMLRETMDGISKKLDPLEFLRIRRSTIIHVSQIKELNTRFNGEYAVVLFDGTEHVSSRRYRKNLEAILKF